MVDPAGRRTVQKVMDLVVEENEELPITKVNNLPIIISIIFASLSAIFMSLGYVMLKRRKTEIE